MTTTPEADLLGRAQALRSRGARRSARRVLRRAARRDPSNAAVHGERALLESGRRGALRHLARAAARDPEWQGPYARALLARRHHADARRVLAGARNEELLVLAGQVELAAGDPERAAARLAGVGGEPAARLRSRALRELGRFDEARALLRSGTPAALVELAELEYAAGRPAEAETAARAALAVDPAHDGARTAVALLLEQRGRPEDALDVLAAAPVENRELLMQQGRLALDLHDAAGALECFRRAAELHEDDEVKRERRRAAWRVGAGPLWRRLDADTHRAFAPARSAIAGLREVVAAESPQRERLRTRALAQAWRRARVSAAVLMAARLAVGLWFALIALWIYLVPELWPHPGAGGELLSALVGIVAWMWVISRLEFTARTLAIGTLAVVTLAAVLYTTTAYREFWTAAIVAATQLTLLALLTALSAAESLAQRRVRAADPGAAGLTALLRVRQGLRGRLDPADPLAVRAASEAIEAAATGLRDHLKRARPTGDIRTDAWLDERADGIAAGLRELKKWLISPGPESRGALAERIEADIRCVVDARWRDLPWSESRHRRPASAPAAARRVAAQPGDRAGPARRRARAARHLRRRRRLAAAGARLGRDHARGDA